MKIIYLGYAVSKQEAGLCSGVSAAGNAMQLNLLESLYPLAEELKAVTIYPVAAWPKDSKRKYKKTVLDLGFMQSVRVGFTNIPVIKQRHQKRHAYAECKRYLRENPDAVLLTFNMYPQTGWAANKLRRQGYKVVPLLADLPIDDDYSRKGLTKLAKNSFYRQTRRYISRINSAIVLNRHAIEVYAPNADYMVMDGAINVPETTKEELVYHPGNVKSIVYGGSLNDYSGILELVEAMHLVRSRDVVLEIYGSGAAADTLKIKACGNVRFYGQISADEMRRKQKQAWLLVSPRDPQDPIAQVTFPSKIFEYMASGRPVLTTRLNGFSEEYEGKVFFAESNDPTELAARIDSIAAMDERALSNIARSALNFVKNERSWEKQARRIVEYLEKKE